MSAAVILQKAQTRTSYLGVVKDFCTKSHYGHLESDFNADILFYIRQIQFHAWPKHLKADSKHAFNPGDEVNFNLKRSLDPGRPYEACNLQFIKNDRLERLREVLITGTAMPGTLLYLSHQFYVRDIKTNILIRVVSEDWEMAQDETYDQYINKPVMYKALRKVSKAERMYAVLTHRRFTPDYEILYKLQETKTAIPAYIEGKNRFGYFVTIQNGTFNGFIFCGDKISQSKFHKGDVAQVLIDDIRSTGIKLSIVR